MHRFKWVKSRLRHTDIPFLQSSCSITHPSPTARITMFFKVRVSQAPLQEVQRYHADGLENRRDRYWPGKYFSTTAKMCTGLLLSLGFICTAHALEDSVTNRQGDITPMCGTKPMIVGVSDGYGGNTWRKTGLAEVKDELSRCKNVKRG